MSKITLTDLVNLQNETTAVNAINDNNATLEAAFDNTLSRDGTSPNQMGADLDMNSNKLLNLPAPISNFEPIRLVDAQTLGTGGTITVNPLPAGGTTGQTLTKNSNSNFDTSWQTIGTVIPGGAINQVLSKNSSTNFDLKWQNAVTSVGVTAPADLTVTGSPVTTSGTIGLNWANTPTGSGSVVRQNSPIINTPVMSQITVSGSTLNLPSANDTVVARNTVDVLTNKSIDAGQLTGTIDAARTPAYAGDVTKAAGSLVTSIASNAVTNGQLNTMAAYTLKGNATGSSANPTDISIPALTQKASPVSGDLVMIADSAASNALKYATVGSVSVAGAVSSVGGLTGAITLGPGLITSGSSIQTDSALIGEIKMLGVNRVPTNYLACDGSQVSRASFSALFASLVVSSVVTITIASPAQVTWTGNNLQNGDPIIFTTTGSLPTGISTGTKYYVRNKSGNVFNLGTSPGPTGATLNTSGTQSGTHTATNAPWEGTAIGNGTTTFTLPDFRGYFPRGIDSVNARDTARSFGVSQTDAFQDHTHQYNTNQAPFGTASGAQNTPGLSTAVTTTSGAASGRASAETRPVNQTVLYVIRYQ